MGELRRYVGFGVVVAIEEDEGDPSARDLVRRSAV
jgi:hypothetical protein